VLVLAFAVFILHTKNIVCMLYLLEKKSQLYEEIALEGLSRDIKKGTEESFILL